VGGWEKVTAAGEVVEEGGVRDGDFDMEGEGGEEGEGEGEGGVEVGGEEVDAGFVGYFYFYGGLSSAAVGAATRVVITAAATAAVFVAAAAEVGHLRGLSIAALELGQQLRFFP